MSVSCRFLPQEPGMGLQGAPWWHLAWSPSPQGPQAEEGMDRLTESPGAPVSAWMTTVSIHAALPPTAGNASQPPLYR